MVVSIAEKLAFIEGVFGKGNLARNSLNFDVKCPILTCDSRRDRSKTKLSIHVETTQAHCWVCGYSSRTLAPLIKKFGTRDQLNDYCTRINPLAVIRRDEVNEETIVRLPQDFELLALTTSIHPDVKAVKKYLYGRGMTNEDFWYYKFGHSREYRWARRAIMPSFNAVGELNYFTARAIDNTRPKRYDNADAKRTDVIFNELNIDWTQRLVLCEGPFDMVKCGHNATALLGNSLNENSLLFCTIVANSTPVAIALDSNEVDKMIRYADKLREYDIDVSIVNVAPFKDPGEMTSEQFKERLLTTKSVSWRDLFRGRLNGACKTHMKVGST